MPHCAAFGCNFQSKGNKGSDVNSHSFPTGKKRRKQWEDACGRTQLPKDPRLCSRHFSPDAFEAYIISLNILIIYKAHDSSGC
uniref:THAP domain-containing protein 1 n=1 Tax=Nothobranchius furzeri TaxID=105023 RepID=A0A8C6LU82_NOTFU